MIFAVIALWAINMGRNSLRRKNKVAVILTTERFDYISVVYCFLWLYFSSVKLPYSFAFAFFTFSPNLELFVSGWCTAILCYSSNGKKTTVFYVKNKLNEIAFLS